jgi:hypothetical protein
MTPRQKLLLEALCLLQAGRMLIDRRANWGTGDYATDADGEVCSTRSPSATCFCSVGAMSAVVSPHRLYGWLVARSRLDNRFRARGFKDTIDGNDRSTHREVKKVWDETIEALALELEFAK